MWSKLRLTIAALVLLASLATYAPAQQSRPANAEQQTTAQSEPAHTSNEAKGATEKLQESPAVQSIAKLTGLSPAKAYWLLVLVNFAVVLFVLWFVLRKVVPAAFRNRTEAIQKRLEEARKTSEDARRRLTEVESRLSRLDSEIASMQKEAEGAGRAEEERVMASADEERRRIVQSATQEIAMATTAARRELKAYAADLAVNLAEERIKVSPSADAMLLKDFNSQLGKDGH